MKTRISFLNMQAPWCFGEGAQHSNKNSCHSKTCLTAFTKYWYFFFSLFMNIKIYSSQPAQPLELSCRWEAPCASQHPRSAEQPNRQAGTPPCWKLQERGLLNCSSELKCFSSQQTKEHVFQKGFLHSLLQIRTANKEGNSVYMSTTNGAGWQYLSDWN